MSTNHNKNGTNSRKSTVYPKKARNVDGAFVFIVNDEDYKQVLLLEDCNGYDDLAGDNGHDNLDYLDDGNHQAVDIEQCLGEGESCRNQDDAPSYGETVCR